MQARDDKYDNVLVILHWVIGIGIIVLAGTELLRHEFPRGHFLREGLKPIHQPLGTILFGLILVRLAWRLMLAKVPSVPSKRTLQDLAATVMHVVLYAVMVALPLLGILYVFGSGKGIDFGVFTFALPMKEAIGGYAKEFRSLHETLGVTILALAFLHAVAALAHHYLLKDGLMDRMRLATRPNPSEPIVPAE